MMSFMPLLQAYLLSNSYVYTVRKYRYSPSQGAVFVPGVGGCYRKLVKEDVTKEDLVQYSSNSGFTTVDNWWGRIVMRHTKINPRLPKLYLYHVSILRRLK